MSTPPAIAMSTCNHLPLIVTSSATCHGPCLPSRRQHAMFRATRHHHVCLPPPTFCRHSVYLPFAIWHCCSFVSAIVWTSCLNSIPRYHVRSPLSFSSCLLQLLSLLCIDRPSPRHALFNAVILLTSSLQPWSRYAICTSVITLPSIL